MFKKTLSASQKITLLRSFCILITLCAVLLPLAAPVFASSILDFNDYVVSTGFDANCNIYHCYFPFTSDAYNWYCSDFQGVPINSVNGVLNSSSVTYSLSLDKQYYVLFFPTGGNRWISLDNIPNGTKFTMWVEISSSGSYVTPDVCFVVRYLDSSGSIISEELTEIVRWGDDVNNFPPRIYGTVSISKPSGAVSACIYANINGISPLSAEDTPITFTGSGLSMDVSISALYEMQQQTGRTNAILQKVEQQLADQGKTLEDVLKEQQDTNDKLDKLPGQIGDEMQGVIENEKEESKSEGNKFVDQILDALPDPSTEVLAALKGLTDATSYTGTDAILPIPAIVLPGIDGLFPETVIWGGTNFDFGEYLSFLPSSLLTLVQSLFTIAIVLFCVYELKSIISYCLTLRESKGG